MQTAKEYPLLIVTLLISVATMVLGVRSGVHWLVGGAAAVFAIVMAVVGISVNRRYWHGALGERSMAVASEALRRNLRLLTIGYAWGTASMHLLYATPLTGLYWQHGWQYGMAMLLLALIAFSYGRVLENEARLGQAAYLALATPLTILQGLLGAGGLLFLVASGKLVKHRPDFAANQVFLFGALIVMFLSGVALRTHLMLTGQR